MRLAIVGFGPRGLGALEAVLRHAAGPVAVDIFEPAPFPGAGPNFSPLEDPQCLLNVPLRDVALGAPPNTDFPGFSDWAGNPGPDHFLPRARLGAYLVARFSAVRAAADPTVALRLVTSHVVRADRAGERWHLEAGGESYGPYDEVLLTLGQPATAPDEQLARWQAHAARHGLTLLPAYPTQEVSRAAAGWTDRTVAIRGLGLSTLDIISLLTLGRGGRFDGQAYHPSGREPKKILPFSRNGLAPAPKPETRAFAQKFLPTQSERQAMCDALVSALGADPDEALRRLAYAPHASVERICGEDPTAWIETELSDPGAQRGDDPIVALERDIAIATERHRPTPGYTYGQVWRAWQPELRRVFGRTPGPAETRAAIVRFDGGLKRYSYGPPVSDARLLRALVAQGIVDLAIADDPDIELHPKGWRLDDRRTGEVMIDGVLPSGGIEAVDDPLVRGLREASVLATVADGAGAWTDRTARVIQQNGAPVPGLSLLGRLAEGSVIGTDSIHDCFGTITDNWARRATGQT